MKAIVHAESYWIGPLFGGNSPVTVGVKAVDLDRDVGDVILCRLVYGEQLHGADVFSALRIGRALQLDLWLIAAVVGGLLYDAFRVYHEVKTAWKPLV